MWLAIPAIIPITQLILFGSGLVVNSSISGLTNTLAIFAFIYGFIAICAALVMVGYLITLSRKNFIAMLIASFILPLWYGAQSEGHFNLGPIIVVPLVVISMIILVTDAWRQRQYSRGIRK